jgi:alkylated DNA repair dioxygenase AlkB
MLGLGRMAQSDPTHVELTAVRFWAALRRRTMTIELKPIHLPPDGWIAHVPGFAPDHAQLLQALVTTLPLHAETVRIMGRELPTPRLTSWHADPGFTYRYSGRTFDPQPWTAVLAALRDRTSDLLGAKFNGVLVSYYRNGADSIARHRDGEKEMGPDAPDDVLIGSISLGAPRRLVLTRDQDRERRTLDLGNGDLLVMGGGLQRYWQHEVPKTRRDVGPRMNLSFRIVRRIG